MAHFCSTPAIIYGALGLRVCGIRALSGNQEASVCTSISLVALYIFGPWSHPPGGRDHDDCDQRLAYLNTALT